MKIAGHIVLVGRKGKASAEDASEALVARKSGKECNWAGKGVGPLVIAISGPRVDEHIAKYNPPVSHV
jgi:hypothetical protein